MVLFGEGEKKRINLWFNPILVGIKAVDLRSDVHAVDLGVGECKNVHRRKEREGEVITLHWIEFLRIVAWFIENLGDIEGYTLLLATERNSYFLKTVEAWVGVVEVI